MTLDVGDTIPDAQLLRIGSDGPEAVSIRDYVAGRKVVMFAVPGAFTGTCSTIHVPSFMRVRDDLGDKGIDEVICIAVNDPFVMKAWGDATGGAEGGITFLADPASEFSMATGRFSNFPPHGMLNRAKRFAMVVEDGKVVSMHAEDRPGVCDISAGENVLATL